MRPYGDHDGSWMVSYGSAFLGGQEFHILFRIRFSRNFNFSDETGYGNDLTDEQIDDLKVSTRDILGEEF